MKELLNLCKRPVLWERSGQQMWDDEHISKGMLEAHLNPNWDAASRKPDFIDRSVAWLHSVIPDGGAILDLGCGPGLYTKRLSDLGYRVTGMDLSRRSIAYAKELLIVKCFDPLFSFKFDPPLYWWMMGQI
jgi:2-polyprenyl-3-methyl-5-hydroxy-6-metoxy-1,4-benzoquinol methylase